MGTTTSPMTPDHLVPLNQRLALRNLEARVATDGKIVLYRREPEAWLRPLGRHDTVESAERATKGVHP